MTQDWRTGFHKALIDTLVKLGTPMSAKPGYYGGWQAEVYLGDEDPLDIRNKVERRGIDYTKTTYSESSWEEFQGSFYEGDTREHGIDVAVYLKSSRKGAEPDYRWRWRGTVSSLILGLVAEVDKT